MLVVCPDCVSSYRVDPAILAGPGRASHCAQCRRQLRADAAELPAVRSAPPRDPSAWRGVLAGAAILLAVSAALAWRGPIARTIPGAADLYRATGLVVPVDAPVVSDLATAWEDDRLTVVGTLANPGAVKLNLRAIRITVRDAAAEPLTSWISPVPKAVLAPGETVRFTSSLDKPPQGGHDLAVGLVADGVGFQADRVALTESAAGGRR